MNRDVKNQILSFIIKQRYNLTFNINNTNCYIALHYQFGIDNDSIYGQLNFEYVNSNHSYYNGLKQLDNLK